MFASDSPACALPAAKARPVPKIFAVIRQAFATRAQRNRLATLDAHLLKDIGLTARMAEDEAARPLWDVPQHWKR